MGSRPKDHAVKEAFKACQDSFGVHPKLIKRLKAYYVANDPDRFFESFMYYLKFPISGYVERSFYVDRTLEFVAKFACSFLDKDKPEAGEEEQDKEKEQDKSKEEEDKEAEDLPLFLYRLFAWLLDHHEVEGADARLRVCQLINKLLKYMGEEAAIDDDLYNKIYDGMLERLKDKVAEIRSQAVTALQRLQDPKDEHCPIIRAYLFHLAHDPNNIVRRTIVRCIGATRLTLPHILERTRDTDEGVRRAAYKFLAEKVHIKSLTIGQREGLLQRGLGERSEQVKKVVELELLPAWLRLSDNNIVKLLHHLDVGNSDQGPVVLRGQRPSAPAGALGVLFQDTSARDLVEQFQYLDERRLVPYDKLTAETAMYWRVLAQYLRQEGNEDCLEDLLPELTPFCQYVRHFVLDMEQEDEDLNWEFVAKELIAMTAVYDLADETGRQHLLSLVKALLTSSKTPVSFIPALVEVFANVEKDPQARVNQVAEVISELKDPMQAASQKDGGGDDSDTFFDAVSSPSPKKSAALVQQEREIMAKQLEVAKLRVKLNEAKESLDAAVAGQDFITAQEVKAQLDMLEEQQVRAEEEVRLLKGVTAAPEPEPEATSVPESDDEAENGVLAVDSPVVIMKCLKLLTATLQDPKISQLNATLHTLMETFVTVSVQSEMAGIRKEAIIALCCLCLRSLDSARQHMLLLLQAAHIDVHEVRIAAISAVVDLLMRHGLASFITSSQEELDASGSNSEVGASRCADTADSHSGIESYLDGDMTTKGATLTQTELNAQGGNSVVAILTKILDEPDLELRTETAEGLCKLLMIGSIVSPKLLSRLLLIWYNPMTEPSCKLRHILGTFFPLYCSMARQNQVAMEMAFIPTMRVLFDAPITSPLSEIDVEDVGMFFVHLTREDMLQSHDATKRPVDILAASTTTVHDSLANLVSNEILSAPDAFQSKVLIKVLTVLQLTSNNFVHLRELKVLSEQLLVTVKERTAVRQLEKFDKMLVDWLAKDPTLAPASVQKRRSSSAPDVAGEVSLGQSPGRKKRVLFSQSQGTLLDPRSPDTDLQVDAASEEELEEHGGAGRGGVQERVIPSPVVLAGKDTSRRSGEEDASRRSGGVDISTSRRSGEADTSRRSGEEDTSRRSGEADTSSSRRSGGEDTSTSFTVVMSSTRISTDSEGEEAEVTVVAEPDRVEDTEEEEVEVAKKVEETKKVPEKKVSKARGRKAQPVLQVESASSEDDIFSDASASSVASASVNLPSGNLTMASTESEEEAADKTVVTPVTKDKTPVTKTKSRGRKKLAQPSVSAESSTESESEQDKVPAARPKAGRGKKVAPAPTVSEDDGDDEIVFNSQEATPKARGGRAKKASAEPSTAKRTSAKSPAARELPSPKATTGRGGSRSGSATPSSGGASVSSLSLAKPKGRPAKTSTSEASLPSSPALSRRGSRSSVTSVPEAPLSGSPGLSRSGRSNSPRIDYKTGKPVAEKTPEPNRKRAGAKTAATAHKSATSSPTPKKSTRATRN